MTAQQFRPRSPAFELYRAQAAIAGPIGEASLVISLAALGAAAFAPALKSKLAMGEGVYLGSLQALHAGAHLGTDVFASQAPGFYLLLQSVGAAVGRSEHSVRLAMLAVAIVGVGAAYWVGRRISGRVGGVLTAAFFISVPPIAQEAPLVHADLPAAVLSLVAIACALEAQHSRRSVPLATLSGIFLAAAISVKFDAVFVAVPALAALAELRSRRVWMGLVGGMGAVTALVLGVYIQSLDAIWNQAVLWHFRIERAAIAIPDAPTSYRGNAARVVDTLTSGGRVLDPLPWLVGAGVAVRIRRWTRTNRDIRLFLWLWVLLLGCFMVVHRPLWPHNVVLLSVALVVATGVELADAFREKGRKTALAAAVVLVASAILLVLAYRSDVPAQLPRVSWAAQALRAHTPPGAYVVSDLPAATVLANRRTLPPLADTSATRIDGGMLDPSLVIQLIKKPEVDAVVIGNVFQNYPAIVRAVQTRFHHRLATEGASVYLRH